MTDCLQPKTSNLHFCLIHQAIQDQMSQKKGELLMSPIKPHQIMLIHLFLACILDVEQNET